MKYALPPKWEQIESLINEFGMSYCQFERFFGLNYNLICQIKSGAKRLPPHAWHFVYEKVKPAYGVGFIEEYSPTKQKPKPIKRMPKSTHPIHDSTHDRLISVK